MKILALTIAILAGAAAFGAGDTAPCPYDGEQAERVDTQEIASPECPVSDSSAYNAVVSTYSHTHINGAFLEVHTFHITECMR